MCDVFCFFSSKFEPVQCILRFVYSFCSSQKGSFRLFIALHSFSQHHKSTACKYSILSKLIETSFFNFEYFIFRPEEVFEKCIGMDSRVCGIWLKHIFLPENSSAFGEKSNKINYILIKYVSTHKIG